MTKYVVTLAQRQRTTRRILMSGAALATLWVGLPIYFLLANALSTPEMVNAFPKQLLPTIDLGSMAYLMGYEGVLTSLLNSLAVAAMTMVAAIALGAPAGYALARFEFRGKGWFRLLIMLTRAFPLPLLALPLTVFFIRFGIDDSLVGLALVHTMLALPFAVLITFSLFSGIPMELEEAAWVFGFAGHGGFCSVRFHHLLERGVCSVGVDGAKQNTDRIALAKSGLRAPAFEVCRRSPAGVARCHFHVSDS
jgi:multiple sugar transport system permease protein